MTLYHLAWAAMTLCFMFLGGWSARAARCNYRGFKAHRLCPLLEGKTLDQLKAQRAELPPPRWPLPEELDPTEEGLWQSRAYARLAKQRSIRAKMLGEAFLWFGSAVFGSYVYLSANNYWRNRYWLTAAGNASVPRILHAELKMVAIVLPALLGVAAIVLGLGIQRYRVGLYDGLERLYAARASSIHL